MSGMKNQRQHIKLLYEHQNKPKIDFDDLQKFSNIEESIEKQSTKNNKPGTVNQIGKGKGKSSTKQPAKISTLQMENLKQNVVNVESIGMKLRLAIQNFVRFAKFTFIKLRCVI